MNEKRHATYMQQSNRKPRQAVPDEVQAVVEEETEEERLNRIVDAHLEQRIKKKGHVAMDPAGESHTYRHTGQRYWVELGDCARLLSCGTMCCAQLSQTFFFIISSSVY